MIPAKFQIPKESASIIFSMIMIFGLGLMAFSREKNESQKTREERKASLITGLLLAAAIWLIASFFSHGKINFVNFLWDFLFDDHNSVLDNTKLLIRFTLIFLVCKAFSFFIYMRTADTETDTEKPAMLKARPNNGESEEF